PPLPRVPRPRPPPGPHRPGAHLGGPRPPAPRAGQARLVPADRRLALLPPLAVARWVRRHRGVPDQVRPGRRLVPRPGPDHRRQAPGRLRWRLRPGERGPAAGPPRRRHAANRVPHPLAPRRPAVCLAAAGAPQREAGTDASVGPEAAPAPPGGTLGRAVARRLRLRLRPTAADPLEGSGVPVARPRS